MFRKLKKSNGDVVESLSGLSLEESSNHTQTKTLSALERIYSFTCTQPTQFPHVHCREFTQQLKHLPTGRTHNVLECDGTPCGLAVINRAVVSCRCNCVFAVSRGGVSW